MQPTDYSYFLYLSFLCGIALYFRRGVELYLRIFPIFLLTAILIDFVALWLTRKTGNNVVLFNFYTTYEFCFYLFVLEEIVNNKIAKMIVINLIWIYPCLALGNIFFIQGVNNWHSVTYSLGSFLIIILCIYYFLEIFRLPKSVKLLREPAFWICTGLLFFNCCSFPFLGLANFLQNMPAVLINNLSSILTILNIFMYILFTIGFLCRLKQAKK